LSFCSAGAEWPPTQRLPVGFDVGPAGQAGSRPWRAGGSETSRLSCGQFSATRWSTSASANGRLNARICIANQRWWPRPECESRRRILRRCPGAVRPGSRAGFEGFTAQRCAMGLLLSQEHSTNKFAASPVVPRSLSRRCAHRRPARCRVDVIQPREVVEVAAFAGDHEPGRHCGRPVVAVTAAAVDVSDPLGRQGRSAGRTACSRPGEPVAPGIGAAQPSREQPDRHPILAQSRTGRSFRAYKAASAASPPAARAGPAPRPGDALRHDEELASSSHPAGYHDRQVGQVGYRTYPVGMQQLIRPQFSHPQHLASHGAILTW